MALAPFAHDWVGGDIDGLAQLADTLYGYVPQVSDVAAALTAHVSEVVGAAGWQGTAASAFTAAWDRDSRTAAVLGVFTSQVAKTIGWLATTVADLLYDLLAGEKGPQVEDVIKEIQKAWYGSGPPYRRQPPRLRPRPPRLRAH